MLAVDHDERRRRIAEATVAVIAQEGLEAATRSANVQGISILALAENEQWSVERTRRIIADEVELLLGTPGLRV
jgi:hypothetical protein